MKKRFILLCIMAGLFSTGMEGCPDLDPIEYVEFTLTTTVKVQFVDAYPEGKAIPLNPNGTVIKIGIVKAGGERCEKTLTVGIDGTATLVCTHHVYKEQPVTAATVFVQIPIHIIDMNYSLSYVNVDSIKITWEEIFSLCGNKYGSSCGSSTELPMTIVLHPPTVE